MANSNIAALPIRDDTNNRDYVEHLALAAIRGAIYIIEDGEDPGVAVDVLRLARDRIEEEMRQRS